jgi:acetyl esterase/lipase
VLPAGLGPAPPAADSDSDHDELELQAAEVSSVRGSVTGDVMVTVDHQCVSRAADSECWTVAPISESVRLGGRLSNLPATRVAAGASLRLGLRGRRPAESLRLAGQACRVQSVAGYHEAPVIMIHCGRARAAPRPRLPRTRKSSRNSSSVLKSETQKFQSFKLMAGGRQCHVCGRRPVSRQVPSLHP